MWEDNEYGPYVRRPGEDIGENNGGSPKEARMPNSLAKAAGTLGVLSVLSIFTMLIYPAIVMGSTAIILALLSRDRQGFMHDKAKNAITSGTIAIVADLAILIMAFVLLFSKGSFKQQLNDMFVETYGQTFDDMWEDAKDGRLDLEYKFIELNNN